MVRYILKAVIKSREINMQQIGLKAKHHHI